MISHTQYLFAIYIVLYLYKKGMGVLGPNEFVTRVVDRMILSLLFHCISLLKSSSFVKSSFHRKEFKHHFLITLQFMIVKQSFVT